jgi:hypothetical protein
MNAIAIFCFLGTALASYPTTCFDSTPVFGNSQLASFVTDITVLQSPNFSKSFRVSQINMCGDFLQLEGI